ncbi:MAG TPA: grasp-with-spasm system SPASM domain peptide maturase [Chitinophaga sp.]|uniref:grasp-with-spasm system SPASM domain peptide maturase n=1 Tax=Chitinophaga sp. TaxID=1869181 RepID=UPI002CB313EB|nr:grasp-with-spasm system SPASM domain peptide maturase [Chitinophaga sp.]HVI49406.1 grasp-with-spasm system SPASM domain peptide maturase [Chitinophaga sp.]
MITITSKELENKYLYMYADCFAVKGYTRTLITDVSRKQMYFVDNSYYALLQALREHTIGEVIAMLESKDDLAEFEQFAEYLITNELGTIVHDRSLFPDMPVEWDYPAVITNAIIDLRDEWHDFEMLFNELETLFCNFIQIRCYRALSLDEIMDILAYTEKKTFRCIQLMMAYTAGISEDELRAVISRYPLVSLTIHGAPFDRQLKNEVSDGLPDLQLGTILYLRQKIGSCQSCGVINVKSFHIPSLSTFMENTLYNGCLNRKISVDEQGEIRNCPSMTRSYGNIRTASLRAVAMQDDFRKVWDINKNLIEGCRDCEYRGICTDCRAYTVKDGDLYAKPAKCGYDPYTGNWLR